ncbi:MAG: TIM barrel protein [Candidatus Bilamarchaeaceae archaeon]
MAKKESVRFGPAGIPIQCEGRSTLDGVRCCYELGLKAMEMEFVQGVRLNKNAAAEVGKVAEQLDISLSSHAPYFINFCSKEEKKIKNSIRNLVEAAVATASAKGSITVFHPGFYQGQEKEEAYQRAKKNIMAAYEKVKEAGAEKVILGAETVGKKSAFGGFEEVVRLASELEYVQPVLDFAHMHARRDFIIKGVDDYRKIFEILEKKLGDYVHHFHSHFSEIRYSEKGELSHLPLGTNNEPPIEPLLKVIVENGYSGTIICETPQLDIDAQKMQKIYSRMVKK